MAASFGLEAGVLMAAQSLLEGAAEIADGLAAEEQRSDAQRRQRRAERRQMRAAQQAGIEKLQGAIAASDARLRRLDAAWQTLGHAAAGIGLPMAPMAPAATDAAALDAHLAVLVERIARLEALLTTAAGSVREAARTDLDALLAAGVSTADQLAAYAAQARLAGAAPDDAAARQQRVARIVERTELEEGAPLPAALDALALQIVQASTHERAEALALELRLQVQRHNETRSAARAQAAAAAEQARLQEAAAVVLEQSLQDLGYAVEEIAETLFVEGGVAHFQRPEWGDYFVRLRIDPQRQAMNFNVVRTGTAGEDRRREDMLAEERWCSAFPKLFETLKARGIPIAVTRLLQAGEAPVQVVDAATLPVRIAEERRHTTLKARSIE
jgi:hypothetical protein